ncbi:hypothetical protein N0V85_009568 [Neurospora sp. IMI 360204]|nr:hypothetical protein N0V85_009568 [Neurospora sp. IMI 360204]
MKTYDQAKQRIKLALKVAILEDIWAVAPNLRDRSALSDAFQNAKREVFRRHFVEEGLDCPEPLRAECESLLTEPDEAWEAYVLERWQEEEASATDRGQAYRPNIKDEEDEEMPLADISEL